MKNTNYKIIFSINILFIALIPLIAKMLTKFVVKSGSTMFDYLIQYCSNILCLVIIGIFIAVLCIKNIRE